jgi:asparagine synthetase B (glutamine-hydrolysing)
MKNELVSPFGDFTVFGFSKDPNGFLKHRLPSRLGINPRIIDFGTAGQIFFYTTYGEVAETEQAIAIKLGFLRSPNKSPLSAKQLLQSQVVEPGYINNDEMRGNALVACLGKSELMFSVYKTILGVPQLYYFESDHEIICSDRLKVIVALLDHVELNEDIVPMHFLFRSTPGDLTYYRQIRRMLPGQFLKWDDGELSLKLVQDLNFTAGSYPYPRADTSAMDMLYHALESVVGDYVTQVEASGQSLATLLSGGVDSSLLQFLIKQQVSNLPAQSISYVVNAPSFSFEIEYAKSASQLFNTQHTFVEFQPDDFSGLLNRTIDELAQPPILETEPSMLSIAEYAQAAGLPARYLVSGQGADGLFGLSLDRKLQGLQCVQRIPGGAFMLNGLATILKPVKSVSTMLLKGSAILASADDPDAFVFPSNSIAVYIDLFSEHNLIRRCFGDDLLRKALQYRRDLAAQYLGTDHYLDKVHAIDLVTDAYEVSAQRQQLFLAHQREQLHPFLDDDILRAGFKFHPDVRYIKGLRPKHLLKDLLVQKTGSLVARKPKGASIFELDLYGWMRSGPLRPLVEEIDLPGFISRSEFNQLIEQPNYFLWELLIFDVFRHRCLT